MRAHFPLMPPLLVGFLFLAGCTSADKGSARLIDGQLEFVLCDALQGDRLLVEHRDGTSGEPHRAWESLGSLDLREPAVISYGSDPPGLLTKDGPATLNLELDRIWVSIMETGVGTQSIIFNARDLPEDGWLNQQGDVVDQPC